jgi:YbbR domain-containing protein
MQAVPKNVRVKGPHNLVENISVIRSEVVDLSDVPAGLKWEVPLVTGHPAIRFDEESEPKVEVEVEPTGSNFRVAGVSLKIKANRDAEAKPDKVALFVNCPPNLLRSLTPDRVQAYVEVLETKPGIYVREVKADLPQGVKLVRIVPNRVQVRLE